MAKITPNNDIYVYDEYYRPEADIRKVCEWIKRHKAGMVWADPSTRNRGPNKQSPASLYLEHGVILSPAPSNDALVRISAIHQYLMRGKLFFSDSCEVTIACLESSEWKPVKTGEKERPLKKEDHARDALAYLLLGHPLGTMLDAVKPGRLLVSTNEGNSFRHHSLDEDTDRQNEILSEEDWLNEFA
jgi:phage terminase large subunit